MVIPPRMIEFLRFCIVGFLGYLVDSAAMEALVYAGLSAAMARVISIPTALQCTFLLHGAFTFRAHGGYTRRAWITFMGCNLMGALINYLIFLAALQVIHLPQALWNRQLALVCGMAVAMWFNYWANRRFVFTPPKEQA